MEIKNKTVSINTYNISLEPKYLTSKIKHHLLNKLRKEKIGKCTAEEGYIINIFKMPKILDNYLSSANSNAIFSIEYEAEYLKPIKDSIMTGIVCMVFKHGVLVEIEGRMQILIPTCQISGFKFDDELSVFSNSVDVIQIDDVVNVKISQVKYQNKGFECIGVLV
jgi:DNA-directed RNA polymerase subunit E'/Rpb7